MTIAQIGSFECTQAILRDLVLGLDEYYHPACAYIVAKIV